MTQEETWPDRIRDLCDALGWSQRDLARDLGIREQTVSDWIREVHAPGSLATQAIERLERRAKRKRREAA